MWVIAGSPPPHVGLQEVFLAAGIGIGVLICLHLPSLARLSRLPCLP